MSCAERRDAVCTECGKSLSAAALNRCIGPSPVRFRQDLIALFDLLQQQKIKPLIAQRFPLAEARQAHELLGKGGVTGKIVLVLKGSSLESGAP